MALGRALHMDLRRVLHPTLTGAARRAQTTKEHSAVGLPLLSGAAAALVLGMSGMTCRRTAVGIRGGMERQTLIRCRSRPLVLLLRARRR